MKKITKILCVLIILCIIIALTQSTISAINYYDENDLNRVHCTIISNPQYATYIDTMIKYHILSSTDNYRIARNLKAGKSAIFFFDGCSDNVDDSTYGDYSKYHLSAYCAVIQDVNGTLEIVYESENCSTIPDNPRNANINDGTPVPTVLDGVYNITSKNHGGMYAALHISDNSSTVPVIRCTATTSQIDTSSSINIHARSNFSNAPTNGVSSTSYSSTGCFNVGLTNDTWSEYNNFIYAVLGISNAIKTTPYSNGSWNKCDAEGIDEGVVIIDRSQYKDQLMKIYGGDNNHTANSLVNAITEYTDNLLVKISHASDSRYSSYLPFKAYPISTGNIKVYNVNGSAYSNRYITGSTDLCTIKEVYTDGWCKVEYPSSAESSGYFEAYVPLTTFISSASPSTWTSTGSYTAYRRSDLSASLGSVSNKDKCLVVNTSGTKKQVIYPVTGTSYYKMGWIDTGEFVIIDSDFPTPILAYNASASAKTTVYESVSKLGGTAYGTIFVDDLCTINSVSVSGNWVNVTYPVTGGTKTGYVYLNQFFPSIGNISKPYTTKVSSKCTAYRKSDMATSIGEIYTTDTITVVGKSGNMYQVLYPVTTGSNTGKYKLAWIKGDYIAKSLTSISVTTKPTKTVYLEGESFSTSGMVVTAKYDDGSTAAVTGYSCSGYSSTPGSKTVTISYTLNGVTKTTAIDVTVNSKSPTSLSVTSNPTKTTYFVGDDFDESGMVVKAAYNNNTSANITDYYTSYDFSTAGTKKVTVAYQYNNVMVSTTVPVTVVEPTISGIAINTAPSKTSYYVGDTLDTTGLTLTATYNDGTNETITAGFTCSPTTLNAAGTKTITVSYGGKQTTFSVTVKDLPNGTMTVTSSSGAPGETVRVAINLDSNPGIIAARLKINYDTNILTLTGVEDGGILGEYVFGKELSANPYIVFWENGLSSKDYTSTGELVYLDFKISDSAAAGDTAVTVSYDSEEIYNTEANNVKFTVNQGKITIKEQGQNPTAPQIVVSDAVSCSGQDVEVTVSLKNNPGISSFTLNVDYDETKLILNGIDTSKEIGGTFNYAESTHTVVWLSEHDSAYEGTVFTLKFTVKDNVDNGETSVTVTYKQGDICNYDEEDVNFKITAGYVSISSYLPGDINGDGYVNNKDLIRLMKYLADDSTTVVKAALDVNNDQFVNNKDLIRLMKHLADDTIEIY